MAETPPSVFLNCPFDDDYRQLFEAIVFTTLICGFHPRSALEDDGGGLVRFDRLRDMMSQCDVGIHDLSRTESSGEGLPRFNMPFELGLFLGAKAFGGPRQRTKQTLILVRDRRAMGRFLSDLAGVDPVEHGASPDTAIQAVRDFFQRCLSARAARENLPTRRLPGAKGVQTRFRALRKALPAIETALEFDRGTLNPLTSYVDYVHAVADFLAAPPSRS